MLLDQGIPERHLNSAYPIALLKHIIPHSATRTPPIPHIVTKTRRSTSMLKRRLFPTALRKHHSAFQSLPTTAPLDHRLPRRHTIETTPTPQRIDHRLPQRHTRVKTTPTPQRYSIIAYSTGLLEHRLYHSSNTAYPTLAPFARAHKS